MGGLAGDRFNGGFDRAAEIGHGLQGVTCLLGCVDALLDAEGGNVEGGAAEALDLEAEFAENKAEFGAHEASAREIALFAQPRQGRRRGRGGGRSRRHGRSRGRGI